MMTFQRIVASIAASCLLSVAGLSIVAAQDEGARTYGDDAAYVRVVFVDYKEGKTQEAYRIINEHFAKAADAAGLPRPVIVHFQTGPWDAAFHWRLEDGMADLEWQVSPNNVSFMKALSEQEGSREAAQELFAHYLSLVARSTSAVGHRHMREDEE